jgi:hypothetical protein
MEFASVPPKNSVKALLGSAASIAAWLIYFQAAIVLCSTQCSNGRVGDQAYDDQNGNHGRRDDPGLDHAHFSSANGI